MLFKAIQFFNGSRVIRHTNLNWFSLSFLSQRELSIQSISKNLNLCTREPRLIIKDTKTLRLKQNSNGNCLVLLMSWFQAKPRHLNKYFELYTSLGFDVLIVKINLLQLMHPMNGSQLVASEAWKFLESNKYYDQILIHGFSVGGYLWGECLVYLHANLTRLEPVAARIKGQVWDSVSGLSEVPIGIAKTFAPKNLFIQTCIKWFFKYYLMVYHDIATKHYIKSEQQFHHQALKVPALIFYSKTDQIGTELKSNSIANDFISHNIDVTEKCFFDSPHVGHFQKNKEEYLKCLMEHFKSCNIIIK